MTVKQIPAFSEEEIAILDEAASIIKICCTCIECDYCPFKLLCGRPQGKKIMFSTDFQRIAELLEAEQNADR